MFTKVARCGLKSQQIQCKFKINPSQLKFPLLNVHPKSCGRRQRGEGGKGEGREGGILLVRWIFLGMAALGAGVLNVETSSSSSFVLGKMHSLHLWT